MNIKNFGITNNIYRIRWFKVKLPGDVAVAVDVVVVLFFVPLMRYIFQEAPNKNETKG